MGNSASTSSSPPSAASSVAEQSTDVSACPVKQQDSTTSECPIKVNPSNGKYRNPNQYNVYSQKIDPKNNMPVQANQDMAPGQSVPLDTNRVKSNIPKGGTDDDSWSYPSPQMFWNSLVRKGKVDDAEEKDMDTVVAIHNNMNENTWAQLLAWEKLHPVKEEGMEPKLLHFMGRPHDLSPKARLKMLFGHPAPFDRHDWVVDRGGEEVRYVIDYYHDESGVKGDQTPESLLDSSSIQSIKVDVRPAIDSLDSFLDRVVKMPYEQFCNNTEYNPPPFRATTNMGTAPPFTKFKEPKQTPSATAAATSPAVYSTQEINSLIAKMDAECRSQKDKLALCTGEEECGAAAVALQRCSARVICPTVAKEFESLLAGMTESKEADSEEAIEKMAENMSTSYNAMTGCVQNFTMACFNATDDVDGDDSKK